VHDLHICNILQITYMWHKIDISKAVTGYEKCLSEKSDLCFLAPIFSRNFWFTNQVSQKNKITKKNIFIVNYWGNEAQKKVFFTFFGHNYEDKIFDFFS
jgi:hypothetical protein